MLANVFTKSILDRWKGMAIGAVSLAAMLLLGMAVYRDIDISLYTGLPEAFRSLINISGDAGVGGLSYGAIYSSYGALTLASLSLSMGAATIAGEERAGTIGLLLANPESRTKVLLQKAAAMVALTGAGALVLWGAGLAIPAVLDVELTGLHVGALVLHMFVISVFFGTLAMAIGGWTGNRGGASGIAAGVMVISFLAVGLLPFIGGWEEVARAFPWYYYNGSDPVNHGVHWAHLGVLAAATAALGAIAVAGVRRRDLKEHGVAVTLMDRLRNNPRTRKLIEKVAGSARVSRISAKALSDHQTLIVVVGYVMVLFGVMMGPFYLLIDDALKDFADQFPEALLAMIGYADIATPEGWFQTEIFSLSVPVGFIVVTAVMGAKALAGEEANRTMGLLLANPIGRTRVLLEKAAAMTLAAFVLGGLTWIGSMLGSLIAGLGLSAANVAATSALAVLLALVFGALALAIGAATGSVPAASFGAAGAALVCYIWNAFVPLSEGLAGLARWSPFYYFLTEDPLNDGMPWLHAGILAGLAAGLTALAVALFRRRDLRQVG